MPCERRFIWFVRVAVLAGGFSACTDAQVDGNPFTGPKVEICGPEVPMDGVGNGGPGGAPVIDGDILTVRAYSSSRAVPVESTTWSRIKAWFR